MFAEHIGLHDDALMFAMALAGLVLAVVVLVQTRLQSLLAWAVGIVSLALAISWWPS